MGIPSPEERIMTSSFVIVAIVFLGCGMKKYLFLVFSWVGRGLGEKDSSLVSPAGMLR